MAGKQIGLSSNQINATTDTTNKAPKFGLGMASNILPISHSGIRRCVMDGPLMQSRQSLGVAQRQQVNGDQVRMDNLIRSSWEVASLRRE
jgi:hypothetical protein